MNSKKNNSKRLLMELDPVRTPILYSNSIRLSSDKNGVVLDIAQKVPGSNRALVVARIGLSIYHAKSLINALAIQLVKRKGLIPRKNKVLN